MSRQLHGAALFSLAAGMLVLTGCGPQDGLGAAGDPVAASTTAAQVPSGGPAVVGTAPTGQDQGGESPHLSVAGLPCPPSDPVRTPVTAGLPGLTLACLEPGPAVTLSGLPAVPTVLNVWATWCAPCREEMPLLADLAADAGDRLTVLGVNVLDDRAAASDFAAAVPLASVYDPDGATRSGLGWAGPPVTYLIDSQGRIVHRIYGQIPDAVTLRDEVSTYLGVEVPSD